MLTTVAGNYFYTLNMQNKTASNFISPLIVTSLLLFSGLLHANPQIDSLLKQDHRPDGVVFEIVEADGNALDWALPMVINYSQQLRQRFPGLDIAVVSHGLEELALQSINKENNAEVHQQVQALQSSDIPVHICETHAGWYGVQAEDFPDYVDVVPAGPIQIELYEQLGFILIRLDEHDQG